MELNEYLQLDYTINLRRDEDGDWVARVAELKGCTAHASSQAEVLERLEDAKRDWIESALEHGLPIPPPEPEGSLPSGKWLQRVPRRLHRDLTSLAESEDVSLTQLVVMILSRYVGASQAHDQLEPEEAWGRAGGQAGDVWRGRLEMASPQAYGVLRSICRRLPTDIRLYAKQMEEQPFDAHAGKR